MAAGSGKKQPAVFFDRDGTLMKEVHFCRNPADVHAIPGMCESLRRLRICGRLVFIVTNQSGVAYGRISLSEYEAVHCELMRQLDYQVDATYFCPISNGTEQRRKPNIGMILEATKIFSVDLLHSYFVGDKATDIECGKRAGMTSLLVTTGYGTQHLSCGADKIFENAVAATDFILRQPVL
ncbi:MAG: HAD-IIIA family hydrolase [Candidatus Xiphinematobacter sp.]|nr:MAG: HAD-IIIA family hydrolase [Candidatus Xiphinematobacter sp.]QQY11732.1 MAG: HAD-IIIA family hydrolase [Candidatus Xiphinematobacter sp.]